MKVPTAIRNLVAEAIEREGYDCAVVIFSKVRRNKTSIFMHCRGNSLTCEGLAEYAYNELCDVDVEEVEEAEEEEEEEDNDGEEWKQA